MNKCSHHIGICHVVLAFLVQLIILVKCHRVVMPLVFAMREAPVISRVGRRLLVDPPTSLRQSLVIHPAQA